MATQIEIPFLTCPLREKKALSQRAFSIYCFENKGYIIWKLDEKKNIPCFDEQGN